MIDPNQTERINLLSRRWQLNTITEEEKREFDNWYNSFDHELEVDSAEGLDNMEHRIYNSIAKKAGILEVNVRRQLWSKIAVIAAAVAVIVSGAWFFSSSYLEGRHPDVSQDPALAYQNDIAPGKNTATLTLANGKTITLSDAKTGVVISATNLTYNDGTELSSPSLRGKRSDEVTSSHKVQTLIAATPRGGTYQVTLPDGTHVWLNADSKLTFPSNFENAKQRIVKLDGEAYFAVVHNSRQPFRVESYGQVVEDIGTEFNINAYADELNVKTTLVEGSARVSSVRIAPHNDGIVLMPNQQAILNGKKAIVVKEVDANDAVDWKNGLFVFEDEPLQSIMRRVARWYNVEIVYQGGVDQNQLYGGSVSRYDHVSKVLEGLELTKGIHFKIEGRRITVMP